MTGNQTHRPNNLHDCSFIIIRNASLRSLHCGTDHPQDCKIARLPGESWMHLAGDAMPCRTNRPQDCKIARLPEESWMHLAGDAMPCRTNHPQDCKIARLPEESWMQSCGWLVLQGMPSPARCIQDSSGNLAILQSCG